MSRDGVWEQLITLQRRLAPEFIEVLERRHTILHNIHLLAPVGRRALAAELSMGERIVRGEVELMRERGLITSTALGMELTQEGLELLSGLEGFMRRLKGLTDLEEAICKRFAVAKTIIVPGDARESPAVKKALGRAAAAFLRDHLKGYEIIAIAGGSTMAEVAYNTSVQAKPGITVIPARGGLNEDLEKQANHIAAKLANKLSAQYRLLHIPDQLPPEALAAIAREPSVQDVLRLFPLVDVLLYGIGEAEVMARRRGMSEEQIRDILSRGAVAESFGYYFNDRGEVVEITPTVGIGVEDLPRIPCTIAVAGGSHKRKALPAALTALRPKVFITDEGAARALMSRD